MLKVTVHHWRFEDGKNSPYGGSRWASSAPARGWYCWAYPSDNRAFESWMKANCPKTDITHRFNSGDPMYTVYINNDQEALVFKLKWL